MSRYGWLGLAVVAGFVFLTVWMNLGAGEGVPTAISLMPPFVAIATAFILRQVIVALFLGIWFGAWALNGFHIGTLVLSFLDVAQVYAARAMADTDHVSIILFSMMIGGMVGVIQKNGGMMGVVNWITSWARDRQHAQLSTSVLGLAIFFDDYANTLVVGNTMRPFTDRMRVSREKLAYLVDSTAAPVASIALISLWIGYEVGLIDSAIEGIEGLQDPYLIFLNSIAYSFYSILALLFVFMVAYTGRDFGPMLTAERRAVAGDVRGNAPKLDGDDPVSEKTTKARYAVAPIVVLVATVVAGLFVTGEGGTLQEMIGSADSYKALVWGSLLGTITAIGMTVGARIMSLAEAVEAWISGMTVVVTAIIILILSWSLAEITSLMGTADYLVGLLGGQMPAGFLPAAVFVLAAITALGTGSSWGTMGILMPLVVPLAWALTGGDPAAMHILYSSVACVLTGAVWGDHCSPISDTTVLSSMASGCDHLDHVRTQMPYAIVVGIVGLAVGTLPSGFGSPWWLGMIIGAVVIWLILRYTGQKAEG